MEAERDNDSEFDDVVDAVDVREVELADKGPWRCYCLLPPVLLDLCFNGLGVREQVWVTCFRLQPSQA